VDFRLDDDQRQLQEAVRTFCDEQIAPKAAWRDENYAFEEGLIQKIAEMGLFGTYVPAEYGGAGLDVISYLMTVEELSRACGATGILVSAHHSLGIDPILNFGSEDQKKKYLPPMAAGERIGCFSITEPGSGSDAGAARCTAVERGDKWVINGTKCFVTNGLEADVVIVFAVTEPTDARRRMTAFIVDKETPGFKLGKKEKKLGIRASSTMEFIFEDCAVPRENMLGERGRGLRVALTTLDGGRLGVAAQAIGMAQACLDESIQYAKTRHQFNQAIANFQAIQWKVADIATQLAAARALTHRAAWLKHHKRPYSPEAAMAKLYASEMCSRAANAAVQVFGGYGYIADYPVERLLRDTKITELYEGTSEIQRLVIARQVTDDPAWVARS
jgi:butyryl-CoA dehydrogenase